MSAPASRRSTLVAATLASGITSLPTTALGVALPTIHAQFQANVNELQWTLTAYSLAYAALLVVGGRLGDILGHRRLFVLGGIVFGVSSVSAALADSPLWLILSLAAMGAGGALIVPASLAIVTNAFSAEGRTRGIAVWGAASGFISGLGPPIGGLFTDELSWRWIFWFTAAVAGVIVLLSRRLVESRDEEMSRTIDVSGAVCLAGGISLLSLGLIEASGWGWDAGFTLAAFGVAGFLLIWFVLVERRARSPICDLALFRYRNFLGGAVLKFTMNFVLGSLFFLIPIYTQEILGYSPIESGVLLLPLSVTFLVGLPLGGRLLRRLGPAPPILGALVFMTIGVLALSNLETTTSYWRLWPPLLVLGFGLGLILTPVNASSLGAVPAKQHGEATGVLSTLIAIGTVMGVALGGAVFKELEDGKLEHTLSRSSFTEHDERLLEGVLAHSPPAEQHLHTFDRDMQQAILHALREAFTYGIENAVRLSGAVLVVSIVLTALFVRRRPGTS